MNGVTGLDRELAELKTFIADLKTDRAAQKEKEQREGWTNYTAISLVFIAVLATMAAQRAGKYSGQVLTKLNDATYHQAQASDQWSYYQAKSIKRNLYEALRKLAPKPANGSDSAQSLEAFNAKVAQDKADEAQIMGEAKNLEKQRDEARAAATRAGERGAAIGDAIGIFQIAVALGSICLVTKKKPLWYVALVMAALATAKMVQVMMS